MIEIKYMAVVEASKKALWLRGLVKTFEIMQDSVRIHCDSQSIIHLTKDHMYCLVRKMRNKILINCKENYNGYNPITKERRIFESPLCLKLNSSCGDGE